MALRLILAALKGSDAVERTLHKLPRHQAVEQMLEHLPDVQHSPIETYLLFLRVASDVFVAQQKHLARFGLSDDKPSVLLQLLLAAQTPLSPSQPAERMGVTRATITDLAAGLERTALLRREVYARDGRMALLHPTERGHALLDGLLPEHFQHLQGLIQALNEQVKQELVRLLAKIGQNLGASQEP
jgi:DNA-binding MarR family transcriptional regulator